MQFPVDYPLLTQSGQALARLSKLCWIVGGAGSGKSTVCRLLATHHGVEGIDMDAHIYGEYHGRFTDARHPVNRAWSTAANGLEWLLSMSWDEFDAFNRAALPEYLDLLAEDLRAADPDAVLLVDGGICNPALLARAVPAERIVCIAAEGLQSESVWEQSDERLAMKSAVMELPHPAEAWHTFLEFDARITAAILAECRESGIRVLRRGRSDSVEDLVAQAVAALRIDAGPGMTLEEG